MQRPEKFPNSFSTSCAGCLKKGIYEKKLEFWPTHYLVTPGIIQHCNSMMSIQGYFHVGLFISRVLALVNTVFGNRQN